MGTKSEFTDVGFLDLLSRHRYLMASHVVPPFGPVTSPCESDVEAELEVDQLDSDSEVEEVADSSKNISRNGAARPGERAPGHTLLPFARVENMVQSDGVPSSSRG